jgi:predicted RNA binding protein YcfA (HicA-like mRNA interferase family)
MPMTAKEIIRLIEADGWYCVSGNGGSHRKFKHVVKPGIVIVPFHSGDLKIKTEKSILKQAGLK